MKKIVLLFFCFLLIIGAGACNKKVPVKPLLATRPQVAGYYVNNPGGYDSLPSLKAHAALIDEIHPLWYHVKPDGSIESEINPEAVTVARQNNIKIIPLVDLVPSQDSILHDRAAQDRAIGNLAQEVKKNDFDGIDIDFEFFPVSQIKDFTVDRDQLTVFMKKIHQQMSAMGKETHMAVLPHVGSSPEVGGIYDYGALSPYLNKVSVMTYDYKEAHGPPGPVAPFAWVEDNIAMAIEQGFKPEQICLGVATYGYDWPQGEAGGFSKPTKEIMRQAAMNGHQIKWSDRYQEPYYFYYDKYGTRREVWFENEYSLPGKLDLVDKYKLSGICIWRLGFEDQLFWDRICNSWGNRR